MAKRFPKPVKFTPKNPHKYVGNHNDIISRSSWETKFMVFADTNPQVIEWGSETTVVPYMSPMDGNSHRYFIDFKVKILDNSGKISTYLVEIKPDVQTKPPQAPKRQSKSYLNAISTFAVNAAKWEAAKRYADQRSMRFIILTEQHLGIV